MAEKIATELNISLAPSEVVRFSDGEVRVRVLEDVKDAHVAVVQSLSQPGDSNLMELCQFGEIIKRMGAKKITAVIPYLSYARQHKAHRTGEAVSVKLVANFIKASGFMDVILMDLHEPEALNYFKIPAEHLTSLETFARFIDEKRDDFGGDDLVIIAPDHGRKGAVENLAGILEVKHGVVEKTRPLDQTDIVTESKLTQNVKDMDVVIFDDMISTGTTAINAAVTCKDQGAFKVSLMATHAVFSRDDMSYWKDAPVDKVYVSDSVQVSEKKRFEKLEIISLAPLIAKNLQNFV